VRTYRIQAGGREVVAHTGVNGTVRVGGSVGDVTVSTLGEHTFKISRNGEAVVAYAARVGTRWQVMLRGRLIEVEVQTERDLLIASLSTSGSRSRSGEEVRAPMPSRIVRIDVNIGQEVLAGQPLLVLEAMKMENTLKAAQGGTVADIPVKAGKAVEKGELLIVLK
jgi:biotin carboxyl carrier protein